MELLVEAGASLPTVIDEMGIMILINRLDNWCRQEITIIGTIYKVL